MFSRQLPFLSLSSASGNNHFRPNTTAHLMPNPESTLVLVTGASGFLGSHVVRLLLREGYRVRGTVRSLKNVKKVDPIRKLDIDGRLELVEADLSSSDGWTKALEGCDYVQHVASPLPLKQDDAIVQIALEGTLNVLRSASKTPSVKKVVLTSSSLAVTEGHPKQKIFTEEDWSNIKDKKFAAYTRSKVIAEQAAWEFVENIREGNRFALTALHPGLILGPPLTEEQGSSVTMIKRFLDGEMPGNPAIHMTAVDVRDVAKCHLEAMRRPESDGQRILLNAKGSLWFYDLAVLLKNEFESQGYKISTWNIPSWLVRFLALFNSELKILIPMLGKECVADNSKAVRLLCIDFRDPKESAVEMAYTLIEKGIAHRTTKYKGVPAKYRHL